MRHTAYGHHHGAHTQEAKEAEAKPDLKLTYDQIEAEYQKNVEPIFTQKCEACHSNAAISPWYAKVPGISMLIESDRTEAKEHLEISKGFPFAGHGEPIEDLDAIAESVTKGTMPTWLYSFMHPSSKLTDEEKSKILSWTSASKARLALLKSPEIKK